MAATAPAALDSVNVIVFCDGQIIADGVSEEVFRKEEVLKQANLKKPTLLEVAEILAEKNLGLDKNTYPKKCFRT